MLPCKVAETLSVPGRVQLVGDDLCFDIAYSRLGPWETVSRPAEGCLKAFVRLARSSPAGVLDFVRRHGVLGIVPEVKIERGAREYREPVAAYIQLAAQARSILEVMGHLKEGDVVTGTEIGAMFSPDVRGGYLALGTVPSGWAYQRVLNAFAAWQRSATLRIGVWGAAGPIPAPPFEPRAGTGAANDWPCFQVDYGHWIDGFMWDLRASGRKAGGHPTPFDTLGDYQTLIDSGRSIEEYEDIRQRLLPRAGQRPSPLFNALVFQLMLEITLEEGTFFCAGCREMRQRDLNTRNKPRTDRGEYCDDSDECRKEGRRAYERQYKAEVAAAKKAGVPWGRRGKRSPGPSDATGPVPSEKGGEEILS